MITAHHEALLQYMRAHRDDMVRDLVRLCRIPSVRSDAEAGMPFGRACDSALREAAALCRENGLQIIVFDMDTEGNLGKVLAGEPIGTLVKP